MELRFTQMLAALRLGQNFLDGNNAVLAKVNASGARKGYDAATDRLDALATEQAAHKIQARGELLSEARQARALRRQQMRPVVKAAKRKLPDLAQLEAVSVPPLRSNSTELVTRGRAMVEAVTPFKDDLVEAGLDADFIEQFNAAMDRLVETKTKKGNHRAGRIGATDGIFKAVRAAREALNLVDARVQAALDEEEPLITEWKAACATIRRAAARALEPQPAGETPTPAPAGNAQSPVSAGSAQQSPATEAPRTLKLSA